MALEAWRHLLLDWSIYVYTPPSIQSLVLSLLSEATSEWAAAVKPALLADGARLYLWSEPTPLSAATVRGTRSVP